MQWNCILCLLLWCCVEEKDYLLPHSYIHPKSNWTNCNPHPSTAIHYYLVLESLLSLPYKFNFPNCTQWLCRHFYLTSPCDVSTKIAKNIILVAFYPVTTCPLRHHPMSRANIFSIYLLVCKLESSAGSLIHIPGISSNFTGYLWPSVRPQYQDTSLFHWHNSWFLFHSCICATNGQHADFPLALTILWILSVTSPCINMSLLND